MQSYQKSQIAEKQKQMSQVNEMRLKALEALVDQVQQQQYVMQAEQHLQRHPEQMARDPTPPTTKGVLGQVSTYPSGSLAAPTNMHIVENDPRRGSTSQSYDLQIEPSPLAGDLNTISAHKLDDRTSKQEQESFTIQSKRFAQNVPGAKSEHDLLTYSRTDGKNAMTTKEHLEEDTPSPLNQLPHKELLTQPTDLKNQKRFELDEKSQMHMHRSQELAGLGEDKSRASFVAKIELVPVEQPTMPTEALEEQVTQLLLECKRLQQENQQVQELREKDRQTYRDNFYHYKQVLAEQQAKHSSLQTMIHKLQQEFLEYQQSSQSTIKTLKQEKEDAEHAAQKKELEQQQLLENQRLENEAKRLQDQAKLQVQVDQLTEENQLLHQAKEQLATKVKELQTTSKETELTHEQTRLESEQLQIEVNKTQEKSEDLKQENIELGLQVIKLKGTIEQLTIENSGLQEQVGLLCPGREGSEPSAKSAAFQQHKERAFKETF